MVKKIISVDLNFPPSEVKNEEVDEVEDKKDEYTEVKEEASEPNPTPPLESSPGPSKGRKPPLFRAKGKKPVPEPPLEPKVEAVPVEPEPAVEPPLTVPVAVPKSEDNQKVKCQHCNKEMTMKSLKYSHSRNCLGLKKTIEKVSNEKVSHQSKAGEPPPPPPHGGEAAPPPPPTYEAPTPMLPVKTKSCAEQQEHPRVVRMKELKEKYNSLVQNAFNV